MFLHEYIIIPELICKSLEAAQILSYSFTVLLSLSIAMTGILSVR